MKIYQHNGIEKADVKPNERSEQICELMGQDTVTLYFSLAVPIDFSVGDYIICFGKKYTLNISQTVKKNASRNYEYTLNFESDTQNLGKVLFMGLNRNNILSESEFSMTGVAKDFLDLMIKNLKRIYPNVGYKIGYVVESEIKTLDFSGNNCLEVLSQLATAFDTEWTVQGQKISLYQNQSNTGIVLGYGSQNGLYSLTIAPQTNANTITRVYAYGADKNLGTNYRNGAKRLMMGTDLYLQKNTDLYGIIETRKIFDEVFPRREGTVSAVGSPYVFTDDAIDFNVNDWLIGGETAKVTFNTGQLAGYTFTINNYNHSAKTFTINQNTDEQTVEIPSTALKPAVGDKYVLVDILMPEQYIVNAEAELRQKAQAFLDSVSSEVPKQISVICDPINFRNEGKTIALGQIINIEDEKLNLNLSIRVIKYTRNVMHPFLYTMELAEKVKDKGIVKLINP